MIIGGKTEVLEETPVFVVLDPP